MNEDDDKTCRIKQADNLEKGMPG